MKEEKIIAKAKEGDLRAFKKLVESYKRKVYVIAYDILKVHEDAEDVSQEVFLKLHRSLKDFRGEAKFSSWLYRIVVNISLNHRRKSKGKIYEDIEEKATVLIDEERDVLTDVKRSEINEKIEEALNVLSEKQRTTFILRHYEQLSLEEIAHAMECSVGTVKSQLFRALQKLQNSLAQYRFEF